MLLVELVTANRGTGTCTLGTQRGTAVPASNGVTPKAKRGGFFLTFSAKNQNFDKIYFCGIESPYLHLE